MKQAEEILRMKIYVTYLDYGYEGYSNPLYVGTDEKEALKSLISEYSKPVMEIWQDDKFVDRITQFKKPIDIERKQGGEG